MILRFEIKVMKDRSLAALTIPAAAAVIERGITEAERRDAARQLEAACARHGYVVQGEIKTEAQANWLTAAELTAVAFVTAAGPARRAFRLKHSRSSPRPRAHRDPVAA